MSPRLIALILFGCLSSAPASAHDFWLDMKPKFQAAPNAELLATPKVGHAGDSAAWPIKPERIVSFKSYGPDGIVDLQRALVRDAGKFRLAAPGTHVIALETTPAEIVLEADKFNAYAAEEGLTPALERRKTAGAEKNPGRELYSRRAKALAQIGDAPTANVAAPIGQTLEITPEKNPLALGQGEPLIVRITYYGEPLAGALVHLESLVVGLLPEIKRVTDENGRAAFSIPHRGAWKAVVVWTRPLEGHPRADFDTVFSSLTFSF